MTKWTPAAWEALDQLAQLDLANYRNHVFDREAFLGTARAKRVERHSRELDTLTVSMPEATAAQIVGRLNPKPVDHEAARRDYNRPWPDPLPPVDPQAGAKLRAIVAELRGVRSEMAERWNKK